MRIPSLREHYTTKDGGINWVPKRAFDNVSEIIEVRLYPTKWFAYKCGGCGKLHVSKAKYQVDRRANRVS